MRFLRLPPPINIAAGVTLAACDPRRASDLWTMVDWGRAWLVGGESLYGANASTDYPPNAIVTLSPLAMVPHRFVLPLWILVALTLTPVLPWVVVRSASSWRARSLENTIPILLYLCWAAPRTLLQFSLLSMALAWAAVLIVNARPSMGGVALGVALFKPHLAGPVALWMLVAGRIRPLIVAAGVVCVGVAVYDLRIGENPVTTAVGWWQALESLYAGRDALVGHTSLRSWLAGAIPNSAAVDAAWIASSLGLLIALSAVARRDPSRALDAGGMAIPAMFSLWSLLSIYHNGNNMILMLPAFAFLWFRQQRGKSFGRWFSLAVLQATLMFDVPVRLSGFASRVGWARLAVEGFDRVVVLATLVLMVDEWWGETAIEPR